LPALAADPDLIICDEPTSALDQLVADEILKLLLKLQKDLGVAYLFITRPLALSPHRPSHRRHAQGSWSMKVRRPDILAAIPKLHGEPSGLGSGNADGLARKRSCKAWRFQARA
jgi:hypothetical protein